MEKIIYARRTYESYTKRAYLRLYNYISKIYRNQNSEGKELTDSSFTWFLRTESNSNSSERLNTLATIKLFFQ